MPEPVAVEETTTGLAPFMRELRKMIPEAVKLDKKNPTYLVGNRLVLELNYYCRWAESKEEKLRTCFPASVAIKVDEKSVAKLLWGKDAPSRGLGVSPSKVYSARTIQVNEEKPIEDSLKRISVAVNKALRGVDDWVQAKQQEYAEEAAFARALRDKSKALYSELGSPHSCSIDTNGVSSRRWGAGVFHVDIDIEPSRPSQRKSKEYFDVELKGLTPEQFRELLPTLKEMIETDAKSRKSRNDSSDES